MEKKNSLFKSKNGDWSSKRIFGAILITLGVVVYFIKNDFNMAATCIGSGMGLLGLGAFER